MNLYEVLKKLQPEKNIDGKKIQKYEAVVKTTVTNDMGYKPNSNQEGVAITSVDLLYKEKKQLWKVPPGMGKSWIILAIVVILRRATKRTFNKVCIAFSSDLLLRNDKPLYDRLKSQLQIEVHLSVGMDETIQNMGKEDLQAVHQDQKRH